MTLRSLWLLVLLGMAFLEPVHAGQSWPRAPGSDFRVLVWNVSRDQFFDQRDAFVRALRSIDADVLIFDEMPAQRSAAEVLTILHQLDAHPSTPWQVAYGSSGYNQRVVFALRGTLRALPQFQHLAYPPSFIRDMRALPLHGQNKAQMERSLAAGVGAFAVQARLGNRRLLLAGVDFQCCGDSDDAWEERRRWVEARTVRRALEQAWTLHHPDAVILAGDFNAVRGRKPVALTQGSATRPAQRLFVVEARHADGQAWTWDGRGTPFPSRPIDFMLHSAALGVRQSIIFDPETMSEAQRSALGLSADQFLPLSSHRPIVVDFAWR